jgi:hypothetical protein
MVLRFIKQDHMHFKQFIIIQLCWVYPFSAPLCAQDKWSASFGYHHGNFRGIHISADLINKDAMYTSFMFSQSWKSSPETPADYNGIVFLGPEDKPQIWMSSFGLMVGGAFSGGKNLRYIIRGGAAFNVFKEPTNFTKPGMLFISNYQYEQRKKTNVGVTFAPRVEILCSKNFGVGAGIFANINGVHTMYGFALDLILGRLR